MESDEASEADANRVTGANSLPREGPTERESNPQPLLRGMHRDGALSRSGTQPVSTKQNPPAIGRST